MHTYEFDEDAEFVVAVALAAYRRGECDGSRAAIEINDFEPWTAYLDDPQVQSLPELDRLGELESRIALIEKHYLGAEFLGDRLTEKDNTGCDCGVGCDCGRFDRGCV